MRSVAFIAILLWAVSASGCEAEREVRTLRLSHILDSTHPVHRGMAHMGARLEELSGGTMRVKIYPNGQLGDERVSVELLQLGMLDMTKVSSAVIENFVPAMSVYSLPYLFRDADHYWQVFESEVGREILLEGEPYWIRGLTYYDAGFRSFYTHDTPVEEPTDLNGLKIRVMPSNISIQSINMLGGSATPMAYGELYTALQQGVVDGAENNPPNFYQSKHFEVSRYYNLDEHSAPPDVLIMSTHTWETLDQQQRDWLMQAVNESVGYQRRLWDEATEEALDAVAEAGVTIIRPDKEPFLNAVAPLYESLEGTEVGKWAERIRSLPPEVEDALDGRDSLHTARVEDQISPARVALPIDTQTFPDHASP